MLLLMLAAHPPTLRAQDGPEAGGHEIEVWTGGGVSAKGGIKDISVWNAGFRFGWVITGAHGPSFLRGRFEYALGTTPIYLLFQPAGTAYGIAIEPIALKWDFEQHRGVAPYFEISGDTLFTNKGVPDGVSRVNFASGGAVGLHFLRKRYNWSAEIRFQHISDAGLTTPNPGIDTFQVRIGFGIFTQPK